MTSTVYIATGGSYSIVDGALAYVNIVRVQRSGVEYDVITGTPNSRQVKYVTSEGKLTFLTAFSGNPANDVDLPEDIIVTYNV